MATLLYHHNNYCVHVVIQNFVSVDFGFVNIFEVKLIAFKIMKFDKIRGFIKSYMYMYM